MKSRNRGDIFAADTSLYKQGKCQPGSHIPIVSDEQIKKEKTGIAIIFSWNIRDVISTKLHYVSELRGKYVPFIPEFKVTGRNYLFIRSKRNRFSNQNVLYMVIRW